MSEPIPMPQRPTELPPELLAKVARKKRFPRTRRWLFNIAAALSLVLFVGNYWLWVRGIDGTIYELTIHRGATFQLSFRNHDAQIEVLVDRYPDQQPEAWKVTFSSMRDYPYSFTPHPLQWFVFNDAQIDANHRWQNFFFPYWFLQLLFAILPLWWLGRFALRWAERKKVRSS